MLILAFESSCDETAAAVVKDGRTVLSSVVYSQADMHATYGGVVPELASRAHVEKVSLLAQAALDEAGCVIEEIDAFAATCAPGLIGALLVGASFAKSCAFARQKPFIPVHHIRGHIAANYIAFSGLAPPFLALVASGGHTSIIDVLSYTEMEVLGATRDDAAGEAFDKIARVLGLPYPGGASLDRLGEGGDGSKYRLPKAAVEGSPLDMSFSGLKTAAMNLLNQNRQKGIETDEKALAKCVAEAVSGVITPRVIAAAKSRGRDTVIAAGGVAANSTLRSALQDACKAQGLNLLLPPLALCGDNAAMIGAQAYYEFLAGNTGTIEQNCFAVMDVSQGFTERKVESGK